MVIDLWWFILNPNRLGFESSFELAVELIYHVIDLWEVG